MIERREIGVAMDFGWTMIPHQTETQQTSNDHESATNDAARLHKFQDESSPKIDHPGQREFISVTGMPGLFLETFKN